MESLDVIFKNGKIVTENGIKYCDLGVSDGKISAIGDLDNDAKIIEDASDLLILPGGVDAHVHIDQPSGPDVEMADNFQSATKSAAPTPCPRSAATGKGAPPPVATPRPAPPPRSSPTNASQTSPSE